MTVIVNSRVRTKVRDERWRGTVAFLHAAGLSKPNVDYSKAWTLDIVNEVKVLP